jgi:hypothetical protein
MAIQLPDQPTPLGQRKPDDTDKTAAPAPTFDQESGPDMEPGRQHVGHLRGRALKPARQIATPDFNPAVRTFGQALTNIFRDVIGESRHETHPASALILTLALTLTYLDYSISSFWIQNNPDQAYIFQDDRFQIRYAKTVAKIYVIVL